MVLSHVFEVARKEWGIQGHNPVRDVKSPPNTKTRDRRLHTGQDGSESEESRLLRACRQARNPRFLPIVCLALETAMRQGELIALRWEHIDLARRIVPGYQKRQITDGAAVYSRSPAVTAAELTRRSLPGLTTEAVKQAFVRSVRRAGLENLRFHDLRHEATTRFFERGLNIMEVASITGHKDLRMLRRYTHLKAEDLARKLG